MASEYASHTIYPPIEDLFAAYRLCLPEQTRVLILGQDPYFKEGQAHGLSFSVRPGVSIPPSLRNVYKELREDLGVTPPTNGDLTGWASDGVLLLNAVLTVRAGKAASHANKGWEHFTDAAIAARVIADRPHNGLARQWFGSPDVLALLPFDRPLAERSYALVWSLPDVTMPISNCVICPTFSSSVIRRRSDSISRV